MCLVPYSFIIKGSLYSGILGTLCVSFVGSHTASATQECVRIPAHSLGLVVKLKENDTAIVEVAGLGQVEMRVQDLTHVSLVISEVDCFKYLGLNLDHGLLAVVEEAGIPKKAL